MTINFFDVLIVDPDTISFLLVDFPDLRTIDVGGAGCSRCGVLSGGSIRSGCRVCLAAA